MEERIETSLKIWSVQLYYSVFIANSCAFLFFSSSFSLGLDLLLRKSQDWQKTAAKFVSLEAELRPIYNIVAKWRRLQVFSWKSVLAAREKKAQRRSQEWFFRLYSLIHQGPSTAPADPTLENEEMAPKKKPRSEDEYLRECLDLLEIFITEANVGDYEGRLALLQSLADQIDVEERLGFTHPAFGSSTFRARFSTLLRHVRNYYLIFLPKIAEEREKLRSPIEQRMKDHVKLCKWDASNYDTLKVSSIRVK